MLAADVHTTKVRWLAAALILALWLLSLSLPALSTTFDSGQSVKTLYGLEILWSGFFGIFAGELGWLANFALLGMVLALTSMSFGQRFMTWCGVALVIFSAWTLALPIWPQYWGHIGFHAGYYVWMFDNFFASSLGIAIANRKLGFVS